MRNWACNQHWLTNAFHSFLMLDPMPHLFLPLFRAYTNRLPPHSVVGLFFFAKNDAFNNGSSIYQAFEDFSASREPEFSKWGWMSLWSVGWSALMVLTILIDCVWYWLSVLSQRTNVICHFNCNNPIACLLWYFQNEQMWTAEQLRAICSITALKCTEYFVSGWFFMPDFF